MSGASCYLANTINGIVWMYDAVEESFSDEFTLLDGDVSIASFVYDVVLHDRGANIWFHFKGVVGLNFITNLVADLNIEDNWCGIPRETLTASFLHKYPELMI